jgi:hypothetical protein
MGALQFVKNALGVLGLSGPIAGSNRVRHHDGRLLGDILDSQRQILQRATQIQQMQADSTWTTADFEEGTAEDAELINSTTGLGWNSTYKAVENTSAQSNMVAISTTLIFAGSVGLGQRGVRIQILDDTGTVVKTFPEKVQNANSFGEQVVATVARTYQLPAGYMARIQGFQSTLVSDSTIEPNSTIEVSVMLTGTTPDLSNYFSIPSQSVYAATIAGALDLRVESFQNVAALVALTPTDLDRANTRGYNAANGIGKGEYLAMTTAAAVSAGFPINNGVNHTASNGLEWIFVGQTISPYEAGVVDGVDSTAELQAFLDHIQLVNYPIVSVTCNTIISNEIQWNGGATKHFFGDLHCTGSGAVFDTAVTLDTWGRCVLNGKIFLDLGGATFTGRVVTNGIRVKAAARARIDLVQVYGVRKFAVTADASLDGGGFQTNKNLLSIGTIESVWCGSNSTAGAFYLLGAISSVVRTGSASSTSQRTEVGTTIPDDAEVNEMVKYNGELYLITGIDRGTNKLTLFPWFKSGDTTGTLEYIVGGGLYTLGGDSGEIGVGTIDAAGCGVGVRYGALYGQSVDRLITQNCGVGFAGGSGLDNAVLMGWVGYFYSEGNGWDIVQVNTYLNGGIVFGSAALVDFEDYAKVINLSAPRAADDSYSPTAAKLTGYTFLSNGHKSQSQNYKKDFSSAAYVYTGTPERSHVEIVQDAVTVYLNFDSNHARLFGYHTLEGVNMGANGGPPATSVTLAVGDATWKINGGSVGSSLVISSPAKAFRWVAIADEATKNWNIALWSGD